MALAVFGQFGKEAFDRWLLAFLPIGQKLVHIGMSCFQLAFFIFILPEQEQVKGAGDDQDEHHGRNRKLTNRIELFIDTEIRGCARQGLGLRGRFVEKIIHKEKMRFGYLPPFLAPPFGVVVAGEFVLLGLISYFSSKGSICEFRRLYSTKS